MSSPASTVVVKKRRAYRRLLLLTMLLIIGSVAGWMIWGAIREWADVKALQEYFAELDIREPEWRDRVYGKPLTEAQAKDHEEWRQLEKSLSTNNAAAWGPYRQGLFLGMGHDHAQPAAMLSAEQVEFMKAAHQFWQPLFQKIATMEKLPGHHRFVERDVPYESMINTYLGVNSSTAYMLNEAVGLEIMYHIMQNDPEQALRWSTLCKPMTLLGYIYASPFLVERWLNLTQPNSTTLLQMQRLLETNSGDMSNQAFINFGSELRLMEKRFRELSLGELTHKQLDRMGVSQALIHRDSPWNTFWLKWARPYYLDLRIRRVFQRPSHQILRLHQLADRIEELPRLDPTERWQAWKKYAVAISIYIERWKLDLILKPVNSDVMPEGLFLLRANYVHMQMMHLFDQQAQLNTALAAVVAERFRVDNGRFPKDWSELTPRYISNPILDPYTGKPLILKQTEKGIVIYSVGRDGKDEGGEILNHNHYWHYGSKGYDYSKTNIGTRVYLPAHRHGPAIQLESDTSEMLKRETKDMLRLMKEKSDN